MRSRKEQRQPNISQESCRQREAVKPQGYAGAPSSSPAQVAPSSRKAQDDLLEKMLERENLLKAYRKVVRNGGAPGVDGVTVTELQAYLNTHWEAVKTALLAGTYRPSPVRRVEIPKPGGGVRLLGIPTVMDRLLQQALLQVMEPIFDPHFSGHSYGFRPGKRAHDAVKQAQACVQSGLRWVVDMDLEKFFDRVNHDILMARVARRVDDKRVLKQIRAYLNAGVMAGVWSCGRRKARRKAARSVRFSPTSCWTTWTKNGPGEGCASSDMICGRLQYLRGRQTGRGTGYGIGDPICGREAETESEPGQKRGGPAVEPKVPRLWLSAKQAGDDPSGSRDDSALQGESPGDNGPLAPTDDGRTDSPTEPLHAGLDRLFPIGCRQEPLWQP